MGGICYIKVKVVLKVFNINGNIKIFMCYIVEMLDNYYILFLKRMVFFYIYIVKLSGYLL